MSDASFHQWLTVAVLLFAAFTVAITSFVIAPYGRHTRTGWGPTMASWLGWIVMESPAVVLFTGLYLAGERAFQSTPLVLLAVWQVHYVHRTFIFPFRIRSAEKRMPCVIVAVGLVFNCVNAYVNAVWIAELGAYTEAWLTDPRLWIGLGVFALGFHINYKADSLLMALRAPGESGYRIPRGWLYDYISCPNYFGELLEWTGWAIATWSLPGLAFALYTAANLGPRALAHHRWYRERFSDYPPGRRALIPFVF